jgi:hypothetical protein
VHTLLLFSVALQIAAAAPVIQTEKDKRGSIPLQTKKDEQARRSSKKRKSNVSKVGSHNHEGVGTTLRRPPIYRVRVTIIDLQRRPIEDAKVWSTVGGEPKKVAGGWQFDISSESVPVNGKVTFHASKETAFLDGESDLQLGRDPNPVITIKLNKVVEGVLVRGIVVDESNNALGEVRVNIVGFESEAVRTQPDGGFVLPAHAAVNQQVLLHAEKLGYKAVNQYHPAGDESATIVLERK